MVAALLSLATAARAAEQVGYAPPEAWIHPLPIPSTEGPSDTGAFQALLVDDQSRFSDDGDVFYSERAVRLRTPQALNGVNLIWNWNPETETLTIHKIHIIRDGQVIDLLAGGKKLTVLRRETNLEAAALDGTLTATIQPEGLRVGDVLDFAISLRRKDPLLGGFSEGFTALNHAGVAGRVHIRATWPSAKPMRWRATEGMLAPTRSVSGDQTELVVDQTQVTAPKKPAGAPGRYQQVGELEFAQFRDWAEVSSLMEPLYRKASTLKADSPLKAEIARIRSQTADPKERALAALKLVQEQTRYVFLGMNLGGYLPADADETWRRRFGDCKGKTALLLALLHELGVDAEPAFVSTSEGDGLNQRLPMLLFDHVLVRAQIEGTTYWLDGTRMGDRTLDDIPPPSFHWALPLRKTGAQLVAIPERPFATPQAETIVKLEIQPGLEAPAKAHIEQLSRGDAGLALHLAIDSVGKGDLDRYLRAYWSDDYPWIKPSEVGAAYDEKSGVMRLWIDGSGALQWTATGPYRDFQIIDSGFGGDPDFHREDGPNKDAPFAVTFPNYEKRTVTVVLPQKGTGFTLWDPGGALDKVIAGVSYKRTAKLSDGVLVVESEERSLQADFPAADADKAAAALKALSFDNLFIRALAPSSRETDSPQASNDDATDSGTLAGRGAKALYSRDYDAAIKAFTEAMRMNPKSAKYVYDRGVAHFQKGEDDLALADFDTALKLDPSDSLTLSARAELELYRGKEDQARRDFDAAMRTAADTGALLRRRGDVYRDAGLLAQAVGYYGDLLKAYPADEQADQVRAELCRAKALAGREASNVVLAACDSVLKTKPRLAAAQEGRALSLLRQAKLAEAIAAFDTALNIDPNAASALYGRGIARMRSGAASAGQADLKSAQARDDGIAARFKTYGLAP